MRKITFFKTMLLAIILLVGSGSVWGQVNHLVISQLYASGGNAGATYKTKFVELFNPTGSSISISGWAITYINSSGTKTKANLSAASIPAGKYYLIAVGSGTTGGVLLISVDQTISASPAAASGTIVLHNTTTAPLLNSEAQIVDMIGWGTPASSWSEGTAVAAGSATNSLYRASNGCTDTNNNSTNFSSAAVNPRNSSSNATYCYATKLSIPTPSSQLSGIGFSITITSQDAGGNALAVTNSTLITLTASGSTISGTTTGTIITGTNSITISGVILTTSLSATITATATSGDALTAATTGTFIVTSSESKLSQSITFNPLSAVTYGDAAFPVLATGGDSGNPVTFTSSDAAVATCTETNGATVTILKAGSCTIYADQAGNGSYNPAPQVGQTLTINSKALTITNPAVTKTYDGTTTAVITGTLNGKVGTDDVTLNGTGTFANANVANGIAVTSTSILGGTNASNYTLTQPIGLTGNITKANQTITLAATSTKYTGVADYSPATSATSGTNAITYTSSDLDVATIVSGNIHIVGVGTTTITASQTASTNYNAAADVTQSLTVTTLIASWGFEGIAVANTATTPSLTSGSTTADSGAQTSGSEFSAVHASSSSVWSTPSGNGSIKSLSTNHWATGDYFQFEASLKGYKNIKLSFDQMGSNTGPIDFKVQYSLNGTDFNDISTYTIASDTWNGSVNSNSIKNIDLSSTTEINNALTIYFRLVCNSNNSISGSTISATGTGRVDNFSIAGDLFAIEISNSTYASSLSDCPTCDVTVANGGTLTVDEAKTFNTVTVESGGKLNTTAPLTVGTVTYKAGKDGTSFSSKLEADITATTVRFLKTIDDTKWYFLSFPCNVTVANITKSDASSLGTLGTDWFIKYYDGNKRSIDGTSNGSNWISFTGATLSANQGYIVGLKTSTLDTEILFPLTTDIVKTETAKTIPVLSYSTGTAGTNNLGWNLVGQPYLSKYAAQGNSNAPFMILSDGVSTYTTYSSASLPIINPFDAYFVQANAGLESSGLTFTLAGRQSVPASVAVNTSDNVQLNVTTSTGADNTYLIMADDQTTSYQIGQDMEKWIGTGTDKPQIYTVLDGINYAFNALPMNSVVNLSVGFYTKSAGSATISVNASQAPGLSKLILTDNVTGTSTDLLTSDYNFTATAGTDNARFILTAKGIMTKNITQTESNGPIVVSMNEKLVLNNLSVNSTIRIYDAIGRMVMNKVANDSSLDIPLSGVGMYIIQIKADAKNWVIKYVNKR